MGRFDAAPNDAQCERILSRRLRVDDPELEPLEALVDAARSTLASRPDDATRSRHLDAMADAFVNGAPDAGVAPPPPAAGRRRSGGMFSVAGAARAGATFGIGFAIVGSFGAAGALPGPLQSGIEYAAQSVGVTLTTGDESNGSDDESPDDGKVVESNDDPVIDDDADPGLNEPFSGSSGSNSGPDNEEGLDQRPDANDRSGRGGDSDSGSPQPSSTQRADNSGQGSVDEDDAADDAADAAEDAADDAEDARDDAEKEAERDSARERQSESSARSNDS